MPPIIATAIIGITIVASAAVWIPARNAASVDPALTLRRE
jgi:ABC-type antimicrobial peptide transport system permease subunit